MALRFLLSLAAPLWRWLLAAALLGVATVLSSVGLMGAAAYIIASAALHPSIATLQVAIVGVRFFGISRALFRYSERLVSHRATLWQLARLRAWFYARLEPLAPAQLQHQHSADILARMVMDIDSLQDFFVRVLLPVLAAIFVGLATGFFIAPFDPQLALVYASFYVVTALLLPGLLLLLGRRAELGQSRLAKEQREASADMIQGLGDILLCSASALFLQADDARSQQRRQFQNRALLSSSLEPALMSLLSLLTVLALIVVATPIVRAGHLNGVELTVLTLVALASFEALQSLPSAMQTWVVQKHATERLLALAQTVPVLSHPLAAQIPLTANKRARDDEVLALEGLSFAYPGTQKKVLQEISFSLRGSQKIAIVGPSGAGKSSLISLLLRFWAAQEGSLRVWGQDIACYDQDALRRSFGVLRQNSYIFSGRIVDNLAIADCEDREKMQRALQQAQLWDFVQELPQGLETWIGEQGTQLSAGQRQRLALARALLHDPRILLLDEPSAHLDVHKERALFDTLHNISADRATLLISHRLVDMPRFDLIFVMDQGRIVERGSHQDLLQEQGLYAKLYRQQWQESINI